jgi:hypothetical protein
MLKCSDKSRKTTAGENLPQTLCGTTQIQSELI